MPTPESFGSALADLKAWLDASGIPAIVVGGMAVSLLGEPRATQDVDLLAFFGGHDPEKVLQAGQAFHIVPRRPDAVAFAIQSRVLLLQHAPTQIGIDVMLGFMPLDEDMIRRAVPATMLGVPLRIVCPEDLVFMKAIAGRSLDWIDIRSVVDAHPEVDLYEVRRKLAALSADADMPELLARFDRAFPQLQQP